MIWMALLSVGLCIWRHEHVGVTMAIKKFPRLIAKALIFVSNGLVMYFLFVLTWYGFRMRGGQGPALHGPPYVHGVVAYGGPRQRTFLHDHADVQDDS